MIKTVSQAIDDIAVSLGANPSAEIPTVAQALENVYTALGGDRTDLDTLVVSEVIDLVAPLIQGGGGGGDWTSAEVTLICSANEYVYGGLCVHEGEWAGGLTIGTSASIKIEIPLYKGVGYVRANDFAGVNYNIMPSTTGSILLDNVIGFVVTGNGSITMAGQSQG